MHTQRPDYERLYEIAGGQAGYFTTRQARAVGFTAERLSGNVKNGKFVLSQYSGAVFTTDVVWAGSAHSTEKK